MTTDVYVSGLPCSNAGALQVTGEPGAYPASAVNVGGVAVDTALKQVYVIPAGDPAGVQRPNTYWRGVAITSKGALYITDSTAGSFSSLGGFRIRSDGALLVSNGGTPSASISGIATTSTGAVILEGDVPTFGVDFNDLGAGVVNTTASMGNAAATFTRATAASTVLSNGLIGTVASGSARSLYSPGGIYLGYYAEGARTNKCPRNTNMGADWSAIGTPTRVGATTNLGDLLLDTIGDDDAGALEGYEIPVGFTGDAVKAIEVYVKQGTSTSSVVRLRDSSAAADRLLAAITWSGSVPVVTMTTGTDLTGTPEQQASSGAYKLVFQTTSVTAANTHALQVYPATNAALATGATGTIQVNGWQAEDATFASSYIATVGTTVTRNADDLAYPITGWLNANTGTALVQAIMTAETAGTNVAWSINDGTLSNRLRIASGPGTNFGITTGGAGQGVINGGNVTAGASFKNASSWAVNDFVTVTNGGVPATDTTGTVPTGLNNLGIGQYFGGNNVYFGAIRRVAYFPSRLANSVLQAMTS